MLAVSSGWTGDRFCSQSSFPRDIGLPDEKIGTRQSFANQFGETSRQMHRVAARLTINTLDLIISVSGSGRE